MTVPCAAASTGPLYVTPPTPEWKVQYQNVGGNDRYKLVPPEGQNAVFSIDRWASPARPGQLARLLDSVASHYSAAAQSDPKIQFEKPAPTSGEIIGDPFTGRFVSYSLKGGLSQVLFIITDGKDLWNGQYVGPAAGWDDARQVLLVLKKW